MCGVLKRDAYLVLRLKVSPQFQQGSHGLALPMASGEQQSSHVVLTCGHKKHGGGE